MLVNLFIVGFYPRCMRGHFNFELVIQYVVHEIGNGLVSLSPAQLFQCHALLYLFLFIF